MKKDVYQYLTQVQLQMNETNKILDKVNEDIKDGLVSDEQRNNFMTYYSTVKTNYDRVMYIIHLLNMPPKFVQRFNEWRLKKKSIKDAKKYQEDLEKVKAENKDAIDKMDNLEKEVSNGQD